MGDLSISSTNGAVNVEGAKFTGDSIDQGASDGPLTVEGVTVENGAIGATSLDISGDGTLKRLVLSKSEVSPGGTINMNSGASYVEVTNAGSSSETALTTLNAREGQVLIVKNLDTQPVTINTAAADKI